MLKSRGAGRGRGRRRGVDVDAFGVSAPRQFLFVSEGFYWVDSGSANSRDENGA